MHSRTSSGHAPSPRTVGFVFQEAALDHDRTVIDNVLEGAVYAGIAQHVAETRGRRLLVRSVGLPGGVHECAQRELRRPPAQCAAAGGDHLAAMYVATFGA